MVVLTKRQKKQVARRIAGAILAQIHLELDSVSETDAEEIVSLVQDLGRKMLPSDSDVPHDINVLIETYVTEEQ